MRSVQLTSLMWIRPFHSLFDLDEGAKIREVADASADHRANGILLRCCFPRIGQRLLQPQRNPALVCFQFQHHHVHIVTDLHDL